MVAVGAADPLIGAAIGRYQLTSVIGEGGMGRVYLAVHTAIGSRVAVKVLSDACTQRPELLERFFAEARAVNLVRHENIVSVIDMATLPDGRPYIMMEFIEGKTLAALVRGIRTPLGAVISIMTEVLSALAAAHAIGIVHRDLKPDNVIVTAEGHAKVLDFGIAKLAPDLGSNSPRTATGALLGTPAYMAPEQISGAENVDARTDLYAAGVVLYECVTGQPPFAGETVFDLMRQHVDAMPRPPRQLRPELPPAFENVILMALEKAPARRFQSAGAMIAALEHAGAELQPHDWQALPGTGRRMSLPHLAARTRAGRPSGQPDVRVDAPTAPSLTPLPDAAVRSRPSRAPLVLGLVAVSALALGVGFAVSGRDPAGGAGSRAAGGGGGSGSAKRATVVIGPHVTANGIEVTPTPVSPRPAQAPPLPFDPKRFDATAFLPKALALAQAEYADVGFTRFDVEGVHADGTADLTLPDSDGALYYFRSPAHSERPADLPPNVDVAMQCYVTVEVTVTDGVYVQKTTMSPIDKSCRWALRPLPRCKLADVWKRARADGADLSTVAKVDFLSDGKWFFDNEYEDSGFVRSYDDACP